MNYNISFSNGEMLYKDYVITIQAISDSNDHNVFKIEYSTAYSEEITLSDDSLEGLLIKLDNVINDTKKNFDWNLLDDKLSQ